MPTFEICILCRWQDDGQIDADKGRVYGGPNGRYSLAEARDNFQKYLLMFSPDDARMLLGDRSKEVAIKRSLIELYQEVKKEIIQKRKNELWLEILNLEHELSEIDFKRI